MCLLVVQHNTNQRTHNKATPSQKNLLSTCFHYFLPAHAAQTEAAAAAIVDTTAPKKTAAADNGVDEIDPADESPAPSSAPVGELVGAAENEGVSRGELTASDDREEAEREVEGEMEGGGVAAREMPPSGPAAAKGTIAPLTTRE